VWLIPCILVREAPETRIREIRERQPQPCTKDKLKTKLEPLIFNPIMPNPR